MDASYENRTIRNKSFSKGRMKRNILSKQKFRQRMKRNILVSLVIFQSVCIIFLSINSSIFKNVSNEKNDIINEPISTSIKLEIDKAKILSKVSSSENVVSITMNGMSDKNYMEEILNILDEYKIKTTFFLSGTRVAEEPDIAKEIIDKGHAIGNYTLTQKNDFDKLSVEEMKKELSRTNEILETKVGVVPEYFRCSNSKYSDQVLQVAATYNLQVAVPDFIKVNSSKITTEEEAKKYAGYLKKGDILSINIGNNEAVVKGIGLLLKEIKQKDYQVLSFKELTDKNQVLYNDNYDEMLKAMDSDKNKQIVPNNATNNASNNVLINESKLNNADYAQINTEIKNENSFSHKLLEKNIEGKSNEISKLKGNINYELLYNSPVKGSGNVFSYAYTTSKSVALTFDGLGDSKMVNGILDALDKSNIKATFFIPGDKVEKNPEIALEILKRGHEIENNTLSGKAMNTVDYQKACEEIDESSKIIKEKLGVTTKYVRPRFSKYGKNFIMAAINTGNEVVTYSKNPLDMDMKNAEEIASYIKKEIRRGEIILLNADTNPEVIKAIPMISDIVRDIGYDFVTIDKLYNSQYKRLKLEEIPGYNAIKTNSIYPKEIPKTISNINDIAQNLGGNVEQKIGKKVALTFDDWGTDKTITSILDNLKKYNVKATFFIRSNGVESNPNLVKSISDGGHDVASHSYSHLVINKTDIFTLQKDLVMSNKALTYAIQRKPEIFFRPPELEISDWSLRAVYATGYTNIFLADLSTHDWDTNLSEEKVINDILTNTESGSIIVLHLGDEATGWKILPNIIEGLQKKGYSFVKISDYIN